NLVGSLKLEYALMFHMLKEQNLTLNFIIVCTLNKYFILKGLGVNQTYNFPIKLDVECSTTGATEQTDSLTSTLHIWHHSHDFHAQFPGPIIREVSYTYLKWV
ncbi:unnamed protein product, partial [Owenia fusiformis]